MPPVNPGTDDLLAPDVVAVVRRALSEPRLRPYRAAAGGRVEGAGAV